MSNPDDDDFDPVEYIRVQRSQDEAWKAIEPQLRKVAAMSASPLEYPPLRIQIGTSIRVEPAARAAFGLRP